MHKKTSSYANKPNSNNINTDSLISNSKRMNESNQINMTIESNNWSVSNGIGNQNKSIPISLNTNHISPSPKPISYLSYKNKSIHNRTKSNSKNLCNSKKKIIKPLLPSSNKKVKK